MVDVVVPQTPLVILHCKTFKPKPNPVTVEFGNNELVIVPLPLITDQVPTPITALFPARVVEPVLIHNVWLGPAFAIVGAGSTCILVVEVLAAQTPFEIVHCRTFKPRPN